MRRIIVKAKLPSRTDFLATLNEIGMDFSEPFWQHDRVFVPKNYERDRALPRLSLRTVVKDAEKPASYILVLRRHIYNRNLDVVDFTVVKDYTETANILYQLGFELKYEISRRRQELNLGKTVKAYIDKIDGLSGYYAKFEATLGDEDSPEDVRLDLSKTFEVLKVSEGHIIEQTYGELLEANQGVGQ